MAILKLILDSSGWGEWVVGLLFFSNKDYMSFVFNIGNKSHIFFIGDFNLTNFVLCDGWPGSSLDKDCGKVYKCMCITFSLIITFSNFPFKKLLPKW